MVCTRGSTPAHAGNTRAGCRAARYIRVYPRPRGEYTIPAPRRPRNWGLPPPTRGILFVFPPGARPRRSTPAHAGNTGAAPLQRRAIQVYPRPRGEYRVGLRRYGQQVGLPPPTRGIQRLSAVRPAANRSTPAHAGNTPRRDSPSRADKVYPRPRGEYLDISVRAVKKDGLPPPTRGILHR